MTKRRWLCLAVPGWLTALCSGTGLCARLWSGKWCQTPACWDKEQSGERGSRTTPRCSISVSSLHCAELLLGKSVWQTFLKSLPGIMSVGNPLSWWGKAHTPFACGLHGGIPIYQAGLLPGMLHSVPPPTLLLCFM